MQVLVFLTRRIGNVVTREEIFDAVWGDVIVGEEALTRAISQLRRALDDSPGHSRYVETIPKVGYRLISRFPEDIPWPTGKRSRDRSTYWWWGVAAGIVCLLLVAAGRFLVGGDQESVVVPNAAVPVTSLPGREIDPSSSPNGATIAFSYMESDQSLGRIVLRDREGGAIRTLGAQIPGMMERFPRWSPDGGSIAFVRSLERECEVVVASVGEDGEPHRVFCPGGGSVTGLDWMPDGASLVIALRGPEGAGGAEARLVRLTIRSGQTTSILEDSSVTFVHPVVSPDGSRIACIRATSVAAGDIFVTDADGQDVERITNGGLSINGLAWIPGGKELLFSSYHGSNYNLWRIASDGHTPRERVSSGPGSMSSLTIDPSTGGLLFVGWNHDTNIWRIPRWDSAANGSVRTNTEAEPVFVSTQADLLPGFSPDGTTVAFVSERSGLPELWTGPSDGTGLVQATDQGTYFTGPSAFSPDGSRLAYTRIDPASGWSELFVLDRRVGTVERWTQGSSNESAPSFTPDGRSILYGSDRGGTWRIWSQNGLDAQPVPVVDGVSGRITPDGRRLVFMRNNVPGLWMMPLGGGAVESIPVALDPVEDRVDWTVTETGIYFIMRRSTTPSSLAFYDFESGLTTQRPTEHVTQRNAGLAADPSGRWILVTQVDHSDSDLMSMEIPPG